MNNDEILVEPNLSAECDVIEFSGTVCEQVRLDRMNRVNKIVGVLFSVIELVALVGVILCFVYEYYFEALYEAIIFLVLGAVCIIICFRPNKSERLFYPTYLALPITITITNDSVSNSYFKKALTTSTKPINAVKKVIDVGEWYYIIFKFGDIGNSWVCQKDLLTKGTIDEFERLFKDKIVRK